MTSSHVTPLAFDKQLKSWFEDNSEVITLAAPCVYEKMDIRLARKAQKAEREELADKIIVGYFISSNMFGATEIGAHSSRREVAALKRLKSEICKVLEQIQEHAWAQYAHPSNRRKRDLVSA
jgi:ribosomal protein S21